MASITLSHPTIPQWGIIEADMSDLKPLKQMRLNLGLSQTEAAHYLGLPLNTLQNYEQGQRETSPWVMMLLLDKLSQAKKNDELVFSRSKGVYSFSLLREKIQEIVRPYHLEKIYLFGSYAKGTATETSDIDLYLSSSVPSGKYFRLLEELVEGLHKDVDLLNPETIVAGSRIDLEIQKTGILIYEGN